ncbi:F0F1 ATP synthase subunit A [Rhodococcus sp. D2-41]|uniref:ATP synthase subunit a n=1 Tax=Speluncibacter jeojiensis TaxID=2710754 RepID=A0A9X4RJC7_9ACTN|nr:F0F1 ATP synthase subunit A [Rhodococcus sp. D2-41]MDG3012839.1 F0F1 ATP synthase subunit A [Rhodococcus sp. D2-41]MDG3017046.1 F0F1 ATP synthase subunit A [Corynebacteriales bacterium D3-21]
MLASGEFHAPSIDEFFPGGLLFTGTPFEINRIMMVRLIMTAVLLLFFVIAMRSPKLIPRGVQNVAEYGLDFVRIHIAEEILGKEQGKRFLPLLTSIFFMVFALNLSSIIPFLNVSSNALIGAPLVCAVVAYIAFNYVGVKKYGLKFYKASVVVPNLPPALHILVIPIEFVSTFVLRPFTLTIRLMANMLAGDIMLVLFWTATHYFLLQASGGMHVFAIGGLAGAILITLFELLEIILQAYIFVLLTAVYIDLSLHAAEH